MTKEPLTSNHTVLSEKKQEIKEQQIQNCWEYKKCGREPGGAKTHEYGVCPASVYYAADGFLGGKNAGRACSYVTGTFCDSRLQGTYMEKEKNCSACEFFKMLKREFGEQMNIVSFDRHVGQKLRDRQEITSVKFKSSKMDQIITNLCHNYFPFNKLSETRILEVINLVRFVEMRSGEIYQLKGGKGLSCLYLIVGSIEVIQKGSIKSLVGPADTRSRPVLLPEAPASSTIVANDNAMLCIADREILDEIMSWDDTFNTVEDISTEIFSRINLIRNSLIFRRLPYYCIESAFNRMRLIDVKKGENVISIGEPGNAYYIITAGKAEVFQVDDPDEGERKIVELGIGDAFGEEALISGKTRSERVCMIEDGSVLVLGKEDFHELIKKPLVTSVNARIAKSMLESGYHLLDVRYIEEYEEQHIPGTMLIPLIELRNRIHELDPNFKYIIYCRSGNRSKVAALILKQNNFENVVELEGGIRQWPYEINGLLNSVNKEG